MLDTHRQLRPFNRWQVRSPWHFYPQTNRQHLAHATRHCTLQGNETYFLDKICDDGCKRTICKKGGLASPTGVFRFPSYRCAPILAPLCPPPLPPRVLCLGQAPPAVCSCSFGPINRMMPGSPSKVESMPEFDIWHSRQKGLGTYKFEFFFIRLPGSTVLHYGKSSSKGQCEIETKLLAPDWEIFVCGTAFHLNVVDGDILCKILQVFQPCCPED